jgi:autotransporter-associated beta strand protein
MKKPLTQHLQILLIFSALGTAISVLGQTTLVFETRGGSSSSGTNNTSNFSLNGFSTTISGTKSIAAGCSTPGSSRFSNTANTSTSFTVSPTGLLVGTPYSVAITFGANSGTSAESASIVATPTATGVTRNTFPSTTTAFESGNGASKWLNIGTIIPTTITPTVTFTYASGSLSSTRWYADAVQFVSQPLDPTPQYWDLNGSTAGIGGAGPATWDTTSLNWNPSSAGTGTPQAYIQTNLTVFGGTPGIVNIDPVNGITSDGGLEFDVTGYTIQSGPLTLGLGTNIFVANGATATINSVITGTNGLAKIAAGTLTLGNTNNLIGTVTVNAGTLNLATNETFTSLAGSAGTVALNTNTLTVGDTNNTTYSAAISDTSAATPGYLIKQGSGTLTLNGTSTFHGTTTVGAGAITIASDAALGTAPASPVANQITLTNAARLDFSAGASLNVNRGITLGSGGGLLSTGGTGTTPTIAGTISGAGNLIIPTGGFDLTGTNTFTGNIYLVGTNVDATGNGLSSVRFDSTAASGSGKIFMRPGNGKNVTLRTFSYTNSVVSNAIEFDPYPGSGLYLSGAVASGKTCTLILSGNFNGTGGVIAGLSPSGGSGNTGGTVAISGSNSAWSGGLTLQYGNLALGSSNALGTGTFNIQALDAGAALGLMATTPLTGASAVTNAMTISLSGGSGAYVAIGGTNSLEISGPVSLLSNTTITVTNTGASILSGGISDSVPSSGYSLTIDGTGTLTLSGVSTYDGGTFINSGTVVGHVSNSIPGDVTVNGGTLQLDVTNAMSPNATLTVGAATVNLNFTGYQTVSSVNGNSGPATYGAAANNLGGAITGTGFLNVIPLPPPFSITSEALDATGTNFVVCWTSVVGQNYDVMTNTSLTGNGAWVSAGYTNASGTTTCFTLPGGILRNPSVFVRIQAP